MDFTDFTLTEEQKEAVDVKLRELLEVCQIYSIPMFAAVATGNSEDGTEYNNIIYGAKVRGIRLKNDQIEKHILIADGFDAVPPRENITMDVNRLLSEEDQE